MNDINEIESNITETFGNIASTLGYSNLHGKILAVLTMEGKSISIQDIADKLKYSLSTISLSVDFLEALGVIKKMRKNSDRKVYVQLAADLMECLRKVILVKVEKSIDDSLRDFETAKRKLEAKKEARADKLLKTINLLEKESKKLKGFLDLIKTVDLSNGK